MEKKIDTLRKLMKEDKWNEALLFAAKFPRLGKEKRAIELAKDCIVHPRFYENLGYDIPSKINLGIVALKERYSV